LEKQEPISTARELRDLLLRDDDLSLEAFQQFLQSPGSREGLYIDFKAADELNKTNKLMTHTIRQYVAAFANSDGGILVIGVKEPTDEEKKRGGKPFLDPINDITVQETDKAGLENWVAQVVRDLVGYLGAPPRIRVLAVPSATASQLRPGVICFITTARAPSLVPLNKNGANVFYFRIEDQAREVPESLVADLLLGRRSTPHLVVSAQRPEVVRGRAQFSGRWGSGHAPTARPSIRFTVTNDSLVAATDVSAGLIVMACYGVEYDSKKSKPSTLPQTLQMSVDRRTLLPEDMDERNLEREQASRLLPHALQHLQLKWNGAGSLTTLRPFEHRDVSADDSWLEALHLTSADDRNQVVALALYLLPARCEPLWYQVAIELHGRSLESVPRRAGNGDRTDHPPSMEITVERVVGNRPIVGAAVPASEVRSRGG